MPLNNNACVILQLFFTNQYLVSSC